MQRRSAQLLVHGLANQRKQMGDARQVGQKGVDEKPRRAGHSNRLAGGDETKQGVWSLACFFVKREFRKIGLTSRLLGAAMDYAKDNGAQYVEAYPVAPDSPSYRFMGFVPTFEKAGFQFDTTAGTRRNVMVLRLTCKTES